MADACGLCRRQQELRESHLLPAALYRISRESSRRNPNPVVVTKTRAGTTSKQVSEKFLCAECEDKFSRCGERFVLSQCARPGRFALRESILSSPILGETNRFRLYEVGSVLGDRVDYFLYFAASVFWRAAARAWSFDGHPINRLSLGDDYREHFRMYLLEQDTFPSRARLFVHVWIDEPIHFTTVIPSSTRVEGIWRHKFCIPGIFFILFLGGEAARSHDKWALNSTKGHFMWLCQSTDDSLFRGVGELVRNTRRKSRPL